MRVLIIDDDPGSCETLSAGLRKLGRHHVTSTRTGREGLALAAAESFDVLVVDQRLPDADGLDLLPVLRTTASADATAYILTAYGSIDDAVLAMKRGAADYLRKESCDIIELIRLLSEPEVPPTVRDPRIQEVISLIRQRPAIPSAELATAVNLSESRLRHLFFEETRTPLGAYQRRARLDRAALLLRVSLLPIKQIAAVLAWSDEGSFAEAFRERLGCSPHEYRAAHNTHE